MKEKNVQIPNCELAGNFIYRSICSFLLPEKKEPKNLVCKVQNFTLKKSRKLKLPMYALSLKKLTAFKQLYFFNVLLTILCTLF